MALELLHGARADAGPAARVRELTEELIDLVESARRQAAELRAQRDRLREERDHLRRQLERAVAAPPRPQPQSSAAGSAPAAREPARGAGAVAARRSPPSRRAGRPDGRPLRLTSRLEPARRLVSCADRRLAVSTAAGTRPRAGLGRLGPRPARRRRAARPASTACSTRPAQRAEAFAERYAGRVAELDSAGLAEAMHALVAINELVGARRLLRDAALHDRHRRPGARRAARARAGARRRRSRRGCCSSSWSGRRSTTSRPRGCSRARAWTSAATTCARSAATARTCCPSPRSGC